MPRLTVNDPADEAASLEAEASGSEGSGTGSAGTGSAGSESAGSESAGSESAALLIEAAHQWRLAGDSDRCHALLCTVVAAGGQLGCYARAELIGLLLADRDHEAAYRELEALAADPALTEEPCQMVAELLTDHGDLAVALEWYDRIVAGWDTQRRTAAEAPAGRRSMDRMLVQHRDRVRRRLGH